MRRFAASFCLAFGTLICSCAWGGEARTRDWPVREGDLDGTRYSPLDQINRDNVKDLGVAWVYHTGDARPGTNIECTPIVVDGVMYITTADGKVVSLDPASGLEHWKFDAMREPYASMYPAQGHGPRGLNRGVTHWRSNDGVERIFYGTAFGFLVSLDARTGQPDPGFAEDGFLDLRRDIERDISKEYYGITSPVKTFENLVIAGFANGEGGIGRAPGDIRAFDARTGSEVWRFHTIPWRGEFGNEAWSGDSWKARGGANAWGGLTIDEKNALVFAGLGSTGHDYWGGDREGSNLFGNCVLCLDARTGTRRWHFQTVRHDLWDLDIPTPPILITVRREGRQVPAVAQVSKTGFVYVLDRFTGDPLFPMEERGVPTSPIESERPYPVQVFPKAPPAFAVQHFGEDVVTDISPESRAFVLEKLRTLRHGAIFTPSSIEGTVFSPGLHGGASWAGASFDPRTGRLYVAANNVPWIGKFINPDKVELTKFQDQDGYPAIKPPWGTLNALDLNLGTLVWQSTLGEFPELTARGIPPTGTENFGGNIVTAGGLVFVAGTMDEMFRAFDKDTGEILWQHKLNAAGYAQPCTYMINGRQYVVIAAGGGGKLGTKSGDEFVAFALPQATTDAASGTAPARKKVVFLAGAKSHGPGDHEYELALRLLQQCLETSPSVHGIKTEFYANGWPEDPSVLDDADTIVIYSDGSDHNLLAHPFFHEGRMDILRKQMARGCGFVALHYSVFAPSHGAGDDFLEWMGGYFDYENGPEGKWYSAIENRAFSVGPSGDHPITRGIQPFEVTEEFYFKMRFRDNDPRLRPILSFDPNPSDPASVVAYAVEREDGGRGFGFTGGHYFPNYARDEYRRLLLNAIVWTARAEVPGNGVESTLPETIRVLIVTGHNHPAHDWRATTPVLKQVLETDPRMAVSVTEDPEFLASPRLREYDVIVQNYVNWERAGVSEAAKANLLRFVEEGKGLCVIHFANGAFRDWPEYRRLVRRVWVDGVSGHDAYGPFTVQVGDAKHAITDGMSAFDTTDELYFNQQGDAAIEPLAFARSAVTGRDEPMAFAYDVGQGRVFQTVLGHDAAGIRCAAELIRRGTAWAAGHSVHPNMEK